MMTTALAGDIWITFASVCFALFLIFEFGLMLWHRLAHGPETYQAAQEWTLSDCVRRWSKTHHWLPMVLVAFVAGLMVHFFYSG